MEPGSSNDCEEEFITVEPWDPVQLRANSEKWSLAGDLALLSHLKNFSNSFVSKAENAHHSINNLVYDTKTRCVKVSNAINDFQQLSNSQFVESRVDEEIDELASNQSNQDKADAPNKTKDEHEIVPKIKDALKISLLFFDERYQNDLKLPNHVESEDEEDDFINSLVNMPTKDQFTDRVLPCLIGSETYVSDNCVGLGLREEDTVDRNDEIAEVLSSSSESDRFVGNERSEIENDEENLFKTSIKPANGDIFNYRSNQHLLNSDDYDAFSVNSETEKTLVKIDNENKVLPEKVTSPSGNKDFLEDLNKRLQITNVPKFEKPNRQEEKGEKGKQMEQNEHDKSLKTPSSYNSESDDEIFKNISQKSSARKYFPGKSRGSHLFDSDDDDDEDIFASVTKTKPAKQIVNSPKVAIKERSPSATNAPKNIKSVFGPSKNSDLIADLNKRLKIGNIETSNLQNNESESSQSVDVSDTFVPEVSKISSKHSSDSDDTFSLPKENFGSKKINSVDLKKGKQETSLFDSDEDDDIFANVSRKKATPSEQPHSSISLASDIFKQTQMETNIAPPKLDQDIVKPASSFDISNGFPEISNAPLISTSSESDEEIFAPLRNSQSNVAKEQTSKERATSKRASLFESDDDEDIFSNSKIKSKKSPIQSDKNHRDSVPKKNTVSKNSKLFDDESDDDIFSISSTNKKENNKPISNVPLVKNSVEEQVLWNSKKESSKSTNKNSLFDDELLENNSPPKVLRNSKKETSKSIGNSSLFDDQSDDEDLFSTLASKRQKAKNLVSITNDDYKDDLFTSNKSQFNSLSNKHKEDNNFDQVDKDLFTQKSSTSRESSLENDLFPSISPLPNDYLKDRAKVGGQRNVRAPTRKKS